MATKPLESILYRELSMAEAKEIIELASPLMQELVNYATNVLARCATSRTLSGREDEDVAALALYRHVIELTDGIEVLLSRSCSNPAVPLLRASFEASLAIEYILESDTNYVQRSLSWLVNYVHKRLEMYERLDPSTARGRDSKRLFDSDSVVSKIPLPPAGDVQKVIANLQSMLSKPHIQPIEIEYRKHGRPEWYELYGGPANLRVLAEHLQRGGEYEILYRQWSTNAHAQDFLPFLARTSTGDSSIRRLRDTGPLKQIASFASTFVLGATRRVLAKYRPGEDFATWYMQEIQARYLVVTGGNRP